MDFLLIGPKFADYEYISSTLKTRRIAITGSPATGKTTLSLALEALGHNVFHEQAREIIQDSLDNNSNLVPWIDLKGFTEVVWDLRVKQYSDALLGTINFYDRTNIDAYAYLLKGKAKLTAAWKSDLDSQCFDKVFFLPVWPEIHSLDKQRMESLEECLEVEQYLLQAYKSLGYECIIVPKLPVEDRVAFIKAHL
jgi:predicted ATPase